MIWWFGTSAIMLAFFGLIWWLINTARDDAKNEERRRESIRVAEAMQKSRENAEKVYSRPRTSVDDAVDRL